MSRARRFRTAEEIIGQANEHHEGMSGEAEALPLPIKQGSDVHGILLYYKEGMVPGEEIVYPPHFMVTIDASTGDIIESKSCVPSDFGVPQEPGVPTEGFGLDTDMSVDEFWDSMDRFMEISSAVWEIYATGAATLDPRNADIVREYNSIYKRIAKEPLIPYYEATAPDFFKWLSQVAA